MIPPGETFDGTFPVRPHFSSAPGFRMHDVAEGAGEPLVLLHGEPTWGYLYRAMIGPLAEDHRVVVPDHMGFGKSETPQDREYSLRAHVENLAALIEDLDLRDVTLVAQDWGGPIGAADTLRHPDRLKRLFFANTLNAHAAVEDPEVPQLADSPWFRRIGEGLETGRYEAVLRNVGSTVPSGMKILGFQNSAAVDDAWLRAYVAPCPTPEAAVGAYSWPIEAHGGSFLAHVAEGIEQQGGVEALGGKPAMLVEGLEGGAILPALAIANFRALWPDGPVVELPGVGHYCQEDAPETPVALIRAFVQTA